MNMYPIRKSNLKMEIIVHLEIGKKVHKNNGIEECGTKKKWFVRLRDELTVKKRHFAQQAEETCVRFQISYSSEHVISAEHNTHCTLLQTLYKT